MMKKNRFKLSFEKSWTFFLSLGILLILLVGFYLSSDFNFFSRKAEQFQQSDYITSVGQCHGVSFPNAHVTWAYPSGEVLWKDLEPQRGQYDWSRLDAAIEIARNSGRKIWIQVLTDNPGVEIIPDWALAAGMHQFPDRYDPGLYKKDRPVQWDPLYKQFLQEMLTAMAQRYDNNPTVEAVLMMSGGHYGEMALHPKEYHWDENPDIYNPQSPYVIEMARVVGESPEQFVIDRTYNGYRGKFDYYYTEFVKELIDMYATTFSIPVVLQAGSGLSGDGVKVAAGAVDYAVTKYGNHVWLKQNGWGNWADADYYNGLFSLYRNQTRITREVGHFQNFQHTSEWNNKTIKAVIDAGTSSICFQGDFFQQPDLYPGINFDTIKYLLEKNYRDYYQNIQAIYHPPPNPTNYPDSTPHPDQTPTPQPTIYPVSRTQDRPYAVHNTIDNQYLIVFNDCRNTDSCVYGATDEIDIYGTIVDRYGNCMGGNFEIASGVTSQQHPYAAYNPDDNEYLVVWQGFKRDYQRNEGVYYQQGYDIWGQRISADGNKVGAPIHIAPNPNINMGNDDQQWHPRVAYSTQDHVYMVVWHDGRARHIFADLYDKSINDQTTFKDIYGQIIRADGSLQGRNFPVTTDPDNTTHQYYGNARRVQQYPEIAYDSNANRFLVVWEDDRRGSGDPHPEGQHYDLLNLDIYGGFFNTSGQAIGSNFSISTRSDAERYPKVAFNKNSNQFMVVWQSSARNYTQLLLPKYKSVLGQRLNSSGNQTGNLITFENQAIQHDRYLDESYPPHANVEAADGIRFMVSWEKDNEGVYISFVNGNEISSNNSATYQLNVPNLRFNHNDRSYILVGRKNIQGVPTMLINSPVANAHNCQASGGYSGPPPDNSPTPTPTQIPTPTPTPTQASCSNLIANSLQIDQGQSIIFTASGIGNTVQFRVLDLQNNEILGLSNKDGDRFRQFSLNQNQMAAWILDTSQSQISDGTYKVQASICPQNPNRDTAPCSTFWNLNCTVEITIGEEVVVVPEIQYLQKIQCPGPPPPKPEILN
jgi:glycosyl hydrolase family 42 (putative beta-galactosidase)